MWRHLVAITLTGCLLGMVPMSQGQELRRSRRAAQFTCEDTETMVIAPIQTEKSTTCKEVIGRPPDRYNYIYRRECQRWLGLQDLPDSVANNYVETCSKTELGLVKYQAKVCCFGVISAQRCFTCNDADNTYDCTYEGNVTSCRNGQVCMTQSLRYKRNEKGIGLRSAQCVDAGTCQAMEGKNGKTCIDYIPSPSCTSCCSGQFCNYMAPDIYRWAADDACKSQPCQHDGTCVLNPKESSGYTCSCPSGYTGSHCETPTLSCLNRGRIDEDDETPHCYCRISTTGERCELAAAICPKSANHTCYNGGTCYDHTQAGYGYRCLCAPGWIGEHCEQEAKLECRDDSTYLNITQRYYSISTRYSSMSCTLVKSIVERNFLQKYLSFCVSAMRRPGVEDFVEGTHGLVGRVESVSLESCSIGEGLLLMHPHVCCPSCYSNPCMNGGWCQQNSDWDYVCQCRFGYEGRNCENQINMCIISGDPHYKTIDGKYIHFQGACKYNLLSRSQANNGIPDFKIFGRNERRGGNTQVSYPNYFEIHYLTYVIKLGKGGSVTVNNELVYPDQSYAPHFKITKNGQFTRFESSDGLIVDYDGSWLALIKVPDSYKMKVDGLCGNFDGDPDNDMMTSSKSPSDSYAKVGISWQVEDPDDPHCTSPDTDNPPQCKSSTEKLVQEKGYCGLLQDASDVFGGCLKKSGQLASGFYESCKYDVCANQENITSAKEAACAILSTFAAHCQSIQIPVSWRTAAGCPMDCPNGMVYKEKTSACAATCQIPDGPEVCSYPDTENCVCPDEMVLINGTCQKPEMCKCPGGHETGSSWLSPDCSVQYKCEVCKECTKRKVAKVYQYQHSCPSNEVCQVVDGVGRCQTCQADGGWSSWSSWSACSQRTGLQSRHRACDNPVPKCGGKTCPGEDEQSQKCSFGPYQPNVPDTPTCVRDFDFQRACDETNLLANPNMYFANPCTCGSFYQCAKNPIFGYYDVYERPCSPCTCWNQDKLTCDHDPQKRNPNHDKCTEVTPVVEIKQSSGVYCSIGQRRFQAIPSDNKHYIDRDAGGVKMPCPPGTIFSVQDCLCVHGGITSNQRKQTLCLEFDDKEHPLKNDQGIYVAWTKSGTSFLEPGVEGSALRFNGDRLEIPYYNNKEMSKFAISLWYRRDAGNANSQTLVSNGDCPGASKASIEINTTPKSVSGGLRASEDRLDAFQVSMSSSDNWHHVVMSYDGQMLAFYLDGLFKNKLSLNGFTARVHCPLLIGSKYDSNYFYGLIDKVCLFDDSLSSADVKQMYNKINSP